MIINIYQLPNNRLLFINNNIAYFQCPQCESLCINKDYKNVYNVHCNKCGFVVNTQSILDFLKKRRKNENVNEGDIDGIK